MLYFLKEKVERISPLVIYLLIFTTFSFDDVWILLGEDWCCYSWMGLKRLNTVAIFPLSSFLPYLNSLRKMFLIDWCVYMFSFLIYPLSRDTETQWHSIKNAKEKKVLLVRQEKIMPLLLLVSKYRKWKIFQKSQNLGVMLSFQLTFFCWQWRIASSWHAMRT